MLNLLISPKAENDLEIIFEYTSKQWSFKQALEYHNGINEAFLIISQYPEIGKEYIHKTGNYRIHPINKHLIFYQHHDAKIIIVRLLHENMDLVEKL